MENVLTVRCGRATRGRTFPFPCFSHYPSTQVERSLRARREGYRRRKPPRSPPPDHHLSHETSIGGTPDTVGEWTTGIGRRNDGERGADHPNPRHGQGAAEGWSTTNRLLLVDILDVNVLLHEFIVGIRLVFRRTMTEHNHVVGHNFRSGTLGSVFCYVGAIP